MYAIAATDHMKIRRARNGEAQIRGRNRMNGGLFYISSQLRLHTPASIARI